MGQIEISQVPTLIGRCYKRFLEYFLWKPFAFVTKTSQTMNILVCILAVALFAYLVWKKRLYRKWMELTLCIMLCGFKFRGLAPCDKDEIVTLLCFLFQNRLEKAEGFPYYPPWAISFDRVPDFLPGNNTETVAPPAPFPDIADKGKCDDTLPSFKEEAEIAVVFDHNVLLFEFRHCSQISRSAFFCPLRGGEREPYDRSWLPFSS